MPDSQYRPAVALYVRSLCPTGVHDRQERIIEHLQSLEDADQVGDVSVVVWGDRIGTDTAAGRTERGRTILARIAEFERWALDENVSMPWFEDARPVEHLVTDRSRDAISLPVMCLAEHADGELAHVTPHVDGDTVRCVDERLAHLATRPVGETTTGEDSRGSAPEIHGEE